MKIVSANFAWTEPHSKQLKVNIWVQKEVDNNFIVEQTLHIEYSIRSRQCDGCKRMYTPHTWKAMVQIRQKTKDKRHILMLEQIIIKHNAHENVSNILSRRNGFDLQFQTKTHAQKFADFVSDKIVSQVKNSKRLVTQDSSNNKWDYKYTLQVVLVPICTDDLVCPHCIDVISTKGLLATKNLIDERGNIAIPTLCQPYHNHKSYRPFHTEDAGRIERHVLEVPLLIA